MNSGLREKGNCESRARTCCKVTGALACNGLTLDSDERLLAGGRIVGEALLVVSMHRGWFPPFGRLIVTVREPTL
jgi:hypothetical protein